jgi:hypothetical protein
VPMNTHSHQFLPLNHRGGTQLGCLEQDDTGQWHAYVSGRRWARHA